MKVIVAAVCLAVALAFSPASAAEKTVAVGYQLIYNPWKAAIAEGAFEKAAGWKIDWRRFDSGAKVITALAAGNVQIALAGSSPVAAAVSRGIAIELFWITEDIASAEALVVRDGSGITAPQDLRGKTIAVPFASTTHFHLLFALEQFGIARQEVTILNMQPPEIAAAWRRGDIDATFIWDPVLSDVKKNGKVLITSGLLSRWGKATFDGLVVDRRFAAENPEFMCRFVKTIAAADERYRRDPDAWTPESPEVKAIAELTGGDPRAVPGVLALYGFPTLAEQASKRWLGGGAEGGAARALRFTSEFLKSERKIPSLLDDYSVAVNPHWVEMALSGGC
ncbi:MAG: taurine ABC transporter substrate-binding protein [Alphaproteobacteria bacterium]